MARGQVAGVGDIRVAKNGYHYTKVAEPRNGSNWVLTHWLTMEKELGRQIDPEKEMVKFRDKKFKRDPYNLAGLELIKKKSSSQRKRIAVIDARIQELQAERSRLVAQVGEL